MRNLAWSLWIGVLAGLGAGPFFVSTAYAQRGASAAFGNATAGSPLGNMQLQTLGSPMYGAYGSPGSISPNIGGVNGYGAVVGGTQNGGIYGSPGSYSPAIGGVNGSGAVIGGTVTRGLYGSPGTYSQSIGGVNANGAAVGGSLNSGFRGSQYGGFGSREFNGSRGRGLSQPPVPIGFTGPNFFPGSYISDNTEYANNYYTLGSTDANYNYNSAPNGLGGYSSAPIGDDQSAADGRFEYGWW